MARRTADAPYAPWSGLFCWIFSHAAICAVAVALTCAQWSRSPSSSPWWVARTWS